MAFSGPSEGSHLTSARVPSRSVGVHRLLRQPSMQCRALPQGPNEPRNSGPRGGCQNDGPFWGPLNTRCRIILRTQKWTIVLTTTHIPYPVLIRYGTWTISTFEVPFGLKVGSKAAKTELLSYRDSFKRGWGFLASGWRFLSELI